MWSCSFVSTLFPAASFGELVQIARRLGAQGLEPRLGARHAHGLELAAGPDERRAIRDALAQGGVTVSDIGSPGHIGESPASDFAAYARLATDVGARGIRVFYDDPKEGEEHARWVDRIRAGLRAVEAELGADAARLWVENHGASSRSDAIAEIGGDAVGVVWDVAHSASAGEGVEESWRGFGRRVRHVHVKDWRKNPDGSWARAVPLFDGDLPITDALALLVRVGYAGFVSAEVPPARGEDDVSRLVAARKKIAAADRAVAAATGAGA